MRVRYDDNDTNLVETDQAHQLRLPVDVIKAARRKIKLLRQVKNEADLYAMKSFHYKKLNGASDGRRSIKLNDDCQLIFAIDCGRVPHEIAIKEISSYHD